MVTVFLLILIVLILLFGAGAVKGWIRGALLGTLGICLAAGVIVWAVSVFGEDGFLWILLGGGGVLFVLSLWARSYNPAEADHKARIKRAQEQRRKRREEGKKW